jgi:hypothetical protein
MLTIIGKWRLCFSVALAAGLAAALPGAAAVPIPQVIDFNRDIRPIFADNCYQCHGPDQGKRKAHLRLDTREGIFDRRDGLPPIVPGKPERSELYRRITTADASERMPEPKSGKRLGERQIALIKKWIEQGAQWQGHWAYIKPVRQALPGLTAQGGSQDEGGSRSARRTYWVRNAIDAFVLAKLQQANLRPSPEADRITLIRRLYFDLLGLPPSKAEVDAFVSDYEAHAYERLVERLLGSPHYGERMAMYWLDLVRYADSIGYHSDNPMNVAPYRDYIIAAFNKNKPFDQFTIEQLAGDLLPEATVEQKIASGYNRILMTTEEGGAQPKEYKAKYAADRVRNASTVWLGTTLGCCQCHDHKFDPFSTRDFYRFAAFFADVQEVAVGRREPGMLLPDQQQAAELQRLDEPMALVQQKLDGPFPMFLAALAELGDAMLIAYGLEPVNNPSTSKNIGAIQAIAPLRRSSAQKQEIAEFYQQRILLLKPLRQELTDLNRRRERLIRSIPKTLVSKSTLPRTVRILPRGNWLDDSGEVVTPAVPVSLGLLPIIRPNRLDLARWIVSRDNPLTARTFVNRLWKLFFGQGLCKTLDDLGSQGEWPTHPELLDWLAVEFMDSGWDVKHMVRLLVTSGSYRQTSRPTPEVKERDPHNRLIARQARFRLDAEMVRDNALAVSGLLSRRIGGPSVKPYQPGGYWQALNFPPREWRDDQGENLYRRGLYTHWQRTFLHPSLLAFDAPTREECTVERPRSNIPQQALVLLNDPTYVEAARAFAERILREGGAGIGGRLAWAFGCALSREPNAEEVRILADIYEKHKHKYGLEHGSAEKLLHTGARPVPGDLDAAEVAAWTSVARVILNLHETITRN